MKTFISVLIIFILLCTFVFADSYFISKSLHEILDITESLPQDAESFEKEAEDISQNVEKIRMLWQKSIIKLSYVSSYELLDRADEAIGELYGAYKARDAAGFLPAAIKFRDTLQRLTVLFGVSFQSLA